jgi:hypothetical protein
VQQVAARVLLDPVSAHYAAAQERQPQLQQQQQQQQQQALQDDVDGDDEPEWASHEGETYTHICDILSQAVGSVQPYMKNRWSLGAGRHHRNHLNEAVIQAELYHQLRCLEAQPDMGIYQIVVESPLAELDGGRADIVMHLHGKLSQKTRTITPITQKPKTKKP